MFSELDETLPFPQGSLDITWKAHRSEGGLEVWALAMPRQMSDRAVGLLKAAGVRPKAAYATAACLPLVFKEHHAILAHIGPSWASVVVSDGMPIVAHRVLLPEQGSAAGHRAQVVARAVAQAEAYHRETQKEQVNGLLPVVLTGSGPPTEDVARRTWHAFSPTPWDRGCASLRVPRQVLSIFLQASMQPTWPWPWGTAPGIGQQPGRRG